MDKAAPDPLQAIRARIDAVDAQMHRLLIERSGVIAELIRIKGTSAPAAAFRPDREADMMRRLVERHSGALPLATVEHIWREIITTFTAMQAPFGIAAGPAADPLAMRDIIRFYFGFSVPVVAMDSNADAIARVSRAGKDIAVVAADSADRWWSGLIGAGAPKIFARLPFLAIPDRPASLPAYVVGAPLKAAVAPEIRVLALPAAPRLDAALRSLDGRISVRTGEECLVELPAAATPGDLAAAAGLAAGDLKEVGGYFAPLRLGKERAA